jgi:hypothetical protein
MAATFERLDKLQAELAAQRQDHARVNETLGEIKATLVNSLTRQIEQINRASTFDDVVVAATGSVLPTSPVAGQPASYSPPASPKCKICGITLPLAADHCPYCGQAA